MPWIELRSGTPYFVGKLPDGAKEIPAPGSEPKPEADKPKADKKK